MCDGVIFVLSTRAEEARFERKSLFDALVIFAGTRIDADLVAGIDEQGNLDLAPVFTVAGLSELVEAVSPLMPGSV